MLTITSPKHGVFEVPVDEEDVMQLKCYRWHIAKIRQFYVQTTVSLDNKRSTLHMATLVNNTPPGMFTDHINGNALDNRKANLRSLSRTENVQHRPNSKGCYLRPSGKYEAQCSFNYTKVYLGLFDTEEEAHQAYLETKESLTGIPHKGVSL